MAHTAELSHEDLLRARDRAKLGAVRASGRGRVLRLALLFAGPGVLAMLGENDGPSMLSYAASGATYGLGLVIAAITGCAALIAAVPLSLHHVTVIGAGYPAALPPYVGQAGSTLFAWAWLRPGSWP